MPFWPCAPPCCEYHTEHTHTPLIVTTAIRNQVPVRLPIVSAVLVAQWLALCPYLRSVPSVCQPTPAALSFAVKPSGR